MRLGTQLRSTIWGLLALQLATAAGAIMLFVRMAPAIQHILEENVVSLSAVQQMQQALASRTVDRKLSFARALQRAEQNVTEPEERALLRRLRAQQQAALAGDGPAIAATLAALEQLARVNLLAMHRSDQRAGRLGEAGGWAMAVLGMICCLVSIFAARRLALHITRPLTRVHDTLAAFRRNDSRRRCSVEEAALEVRDIGRAVDELLDAFERNDRRPAQEAQPEAGEQLRAALLALLDERSQPTFVLARAGEVLAANQSGLDALAQQDGLRERLQRRTNAAAGADGADAAGEGEGEGEGEGAAPAIALRAAGASWIASLSARASRP